MNKLATLATQPNAESEIADLLKKNISSKISIIAMNLYDLNWNRKPLSPVHKDMCEDTFGLVDLCIDLYLDLISNGINNPKIISSLDYLHKLKFETLPQYNSL